MASGALLQFAALWLKLRADRHAVTALECGLIAGVIVANLAPGFALLADDLSSQFHTIGTRINADQTTNQSLPV